MRSTRFVQADVFSASPFGGNPVVVILDAQEMTPDDMQAIARGMNFAETSFVLAATQPEADFQVRFFTPATEVPFSGHLALGTAYVLMTQTSGPFTGRRRVVAQTKVGLLRVDAEMEASRLTRVAVTENPPLFGPTLLDLEALSTALGLTATVGQAGPPQLVTTTLPTLVVPVPRRADLRGPADRAALVEVCRSVGASVVAVFTRETLQPQHTVYVRVFAPLLGVDEDPATGSANAALAAYLVHHAALPGRPPLRITAEQGYAVGRPSLIVVDVDETETGLQVRVGGHVARAAEGAIYY